VQHVTSNVNNTVRYNIIIGCLCGYLSVVTTLCLCRQYVLANEGVSSSGAVQETIPGVASSGGAGEDEDDTDPLNTSLHSSLQTSEGYDEMVPSDNQGIAMAGS
jgi:hypothetical protein